MLRALLAPVVVISLGKLMGFQVCDVFLNGIQMTDPWRESPWCEKEKEVRKQSASVGNRLGWMSLKVQTVEVLHVEESK